MREYLFRGKTDFNRWAYGSLIVAEFDYRDNYYCILESEDDVHPMDWPYLDGFIGTFDGKATTINPETVGQWTGLVDKNGVKIFEGDIIKCSIIYDIGCYPHSRPEVREVIYREGCFNPLYDCERNTYEVIGNKWDNPELIDAIGGN